jgi:hypothetical protein
VYYALGTKLAQDTNRTGGVMVSMLPSSTDECGFEPRLVQTQRQYNGYLLLVYFALVLYKTKIDVKKGNKTNIIE